MSGSPLSRRRLLVSVGTVTAAALAGCDLDPSSSSPAAEPSPDPDQALVTAARAELSGLITRLSGRPGTAALVAVHRVQLEALQGEPPATTPSNRTLTPARLRVLERRAADRFSRWASASGNGDLARVLASIAAGIRMQPVLREAT